jgi:hypothetical protein
MMVSIIADIQAVLALLLPELMHQENPIEFSLSCRSFVNTLPVSSPFKIFFKK